jgi:hypothetical protein
MIKKTKRLVLNRETIRNLDNTQLAGIAGGSVAGCPASIGPQCNTQNNCSALCTTSTIGGGGGGSGGGGGGGTGALSDCSCTIKQQ